MGKFLNFYQDTTPRDITNAEVDVALKKQVDNTDKSLTVVASMCLTRLVEGRLMLDFIPRLNGRYMAPIPDDTDVCRNEDDLTLGRYVLFIPADSDAARLMLRLVSEKRYLELTTGQLTDEEWDSPGKPA